MNAQRQKDALNTLNVHADAIQAPCSRWADAPWYTIDVGGAITNASVLSTSGGTGKIIDAGEEGRRVL